MNVRDHIEVHVVDGDEPRPGESPAQYLMRLHDGDERLNRLLALDRPAPSADFDERFFDRLAGQRIIERAQRLEAAEAPAVEEPRLEALLALDAPGPSADFDADFRRRLRGEVEADAALRLPSADALRVPALPKHESPMFQRSKGPNPFSPRRFAVVAVLAAASLVVTFWFAWQEQALQPPDEELAMVAHLDLLENYEEIEAFEALRDEDVFDVVASLDVLAHEGADEGEFGRDGERTPEVLHP